jgi:hypothetical protein
MRDLFSFNMPKTNKKQGQRRPMKRRSQNNEISTTWSSLSGKVPHLQPAMRFDNQVYRFFQTIDYPSVFTATTSTPGVYSLAPQLNSIAGTQLAALQGVFDQYKIEEIEVWCEAQNQGGSGTTPIDQIGGKLYSVIDYDDAANLATVAAALNYSNCIVSSFNQGHYRKWKPHIAMAAYSGAFTSYANMKAQWLDIASAAVQHYGCKFITDLSTSTSNVSWDLRVRIRVSCRNIR